MLSRKRVLLSFLLGRGLWVGSTVLLGALAGTVALAQVELSGLDDEQRANARAFLHLDDLPCDAPPWIVRWRFNEADREIREGLEALGYYDVRIRKSLRFDEDCWQAQFDIEPGEPVQVTAVQVSMDGDLADHPRAAGWQRRVEAMEDRNLHHGVYEANKRELLEMAFELGYFDAAYRRSRVEVDVEAGTARIELAFASGERYRFGAVTFSDAPLRRDLLESYVPFSEGDPYESRLVGGLRRNLSDSGYFAQVRVEANVDEAVDRAIPVQVTLVTPRRARTYQVGAGFATDTGVRARADLNVRQHNDRGHRSTSRLFLSEIQQSVEGSYFIPHENPLDDWFVLEAAAGREETVTSISLLSRVGLRHTYVRRRWIETDFIDLRFESFEVGEETGSSRLVIVGKNWTRTWGDSAVRPMNAFRFGGEIRGAIAQLGSDTDFAQGRLNAKWARRVVGNTRVLLRGEVGGTVRRAFDELPPSVRFFAGGDTSIRGYNFRSIGTEVDGEVIGGNHMIVGSAEIDFRIRPQWSLALFIDSGTAFSETLDFHTGAGVGARWFSPIGPVRLDIAYPFDDPGRAFRVHVSLGPDL